MSGTTRSPSSRGSGTSDLVLYMSTCLYYVYLEGRRRGYGLNASKTNMVVDHHK